jgi:hypothetical protein
LYIQVPILDTTVAIQMTVKARWRKAARAGEATRGAAGRWLGADFSRLVTVARLLVAGR